MADTVKVQPVTTAVTPQSLVTEEKVKAALKNDKGSDALFTSWTVEDFTKTGDNIASVVSSVRVKFSLKQKDIEVVYIVKLNPCRQMKEFNEFIFDIFYKESKMYSNLLAELNSTMVEIGRKVLRFPQIFHSSLDTGKEVIFLEDLRSRGFRMFDKKRGLDVPHAILILQELARLHAASRLLQAKTPEQDLAVRHDLLGKDAMVDDKSVLTFLAEQINIGIKMLEKIDGYERSIAWIQSLVPKLGETLREQLGRSKYNVVCHGDCWNNNVLFRYNDNGDPAEVMLLDLQITRLASPATDLNYLLYTSLIGEVRKPNLEAFLETYHTAFSAVMEAAGKDMIFNPSELLQEFRDKNIYGAIFALVIVPLIVLAPQNTPDMNTAKNLNVLMEEFKEKALESLDKNPLIRPRFLALFDEMMEIGLMP